MEGWWYILSKEISKVSKKPHYQKLEFLTPIPESYNLTRTLYSQELQDDLLRYPVEKQKMLIIVTGICYNNYDKYVNHGGTIQLSVGKKIDTRDIELKFSTLKSVSPYKDYIFGELRGDDRLGVYGDLFYKFENIINSIKTYTIVYDMRNGIQEVTLHNLGNYGRILTTCNLLKP